MPNSVLEVTPLLGDRPHNADTNIEGAHGSEPSFTAGSHATPPAQGPRLRFVLICLFGTLFFLAFRLAFIERTSFSRDLKRFRGDRLSFAEAQREYTEELTHVNRAREWLEEYTLTPHLAGALPLTSFTEWQFARLGLKVRRRSYTVATSRHEASHLNLLGEDGRVVEALSLHEDILLEDEATERDTDLAYHGFAATGNVTARYVFANYCTLDDFTALVKRNVEVAGMIVICRYERLFRGLKVKNAETHGAVGVILYSDPSDDGEVRVSKGHASYPRGPARNPSSIQRGSVLYVTDEPGGSLRPLIPLIPISHQAIEPVLALLNSVTFEGPPWGSDDEDHGPRWSGDLRSFNYSPGPSTLELNLFNNATDTHTRVHNIVGKIHGIMSDEEIIIGNHRDSWVVGGAGDPNSGSAVMLEVIRGLGALSAQGWKPLRTLTFVSWDAEELGMLGSTAFAKDQARRLSPKAVCYLNLDMGVTGSYFSVKGHPLLKHVFESTAEKVAFNHTLSLAAYWKHQPNNGTVDLLGAGSDYSAFQHHLGIPSVDLRFSNDGITDPVYHYHSHFDSLHWMDRFGDPHYRKHNILALYLGLAVIELADTEVTPLRVSAYASMLQREFAALTMPQEWLSRSVYRNRALALTTTLERLQSAAKAYDHTLKDLQAEATRDYPWFRSHRKVKLAFKLRSANRKLLQVDRVFVNPAGLASRPWMRHVVFAPHREVGYAGEVFAGLQEAIRDGAYGQALEWFETMEGMLETVLNSLG